MKTVDFIEELKVQSKAKVAIWNEAHAILQAAKDVEHQNAIDSAGLIDASAPLLDATEVISLIVCVASLAGLVLIVAMRF